MHITIFTMFDWESAFLFCHVLLCLAGLWSLFHQSIFLTFLSPIVWKICFVFSILLIFVISQLPFQILFFKLMLLYVPLILIFFTRFLLTFVREQQFYLQFEFFLNTLIAQIKIGSGFRPAFKSSARALPDSYFQNYFMEILEMILFSKKPAKEFSFSPLRQMIEELKRADSSSQCLELLENLRHHIHIRSVFRKKVQSALLQIRIQSFVLFILYSGLLIFVLNKYGLKYIKILLISFFLFITGFLILLQHGRKIKWTI